MILGKGALKRGRVLPLLTLLGTVWCAVAGAWTEGAPPLLEHDGEVLLPAQEWPRQPGPRTIKVYVRYPEGSLKGVNAETGLMLSLHCWGHSGWTATADPSELANRFNVIGISVDYLQSGEYDPAANPLPYDYGYFQALDALRALYYVFNGLDKLERPFHRGRIFATGGSGGGNIALMANKLAPRTFACVVDMCGMAKLSNDIAFGMPGGTRLNACYSRDPESPRYLSSDAQALRYVGDPDHLRKMKQLGNVGKVIVIHGSEDDLVPPQDSREMVENMRDAEFDAELHLITQEHVDGSVIQSTGHILGDWTAIVFRFADQYLLPNSPTALTRAGVSDLECSDEEVRYRTQNGTYVISYASGYPVGRFETR